MSQKRKMVDDYITPTPSKIRKIDSHHNPRKKRKKKKKKKSFHLPSTLLKKTARPCHVKNIPHGTMQDEVDAALGYAQEKTF